MGLTLLTLPGGIEMAFQHIVPGGIASNGAACPATLRMGSRGYLQREEPIHTVRMTRPFYLGMYPVTHAEFLAWKPNHRFGFPAAPQCPEELCRPAENVTWDEAVAYCDWLNDVCRAQIPAGYVAGLPSEARWEYACRAGTETEYYTGDGETALAEAGWFGTNSGGSTQPVGQLRPNGFGLYDIHGNVWEWCRDAWDEDAYKRRVDGVCDPKLPDEAGAYRVVRGGAWDCSARSCRSACRDRWLPANWYVFLGFRVCLRSVPSQSGKSGERGTRERRARIFFRRPAPS